MSEKAPAETPGVHSRGLVISSSGSLLIPAPLHIPSAARTCICIQITCFPYHYLAEITVLSQMCLLQKFSPIQGLCCHFFFDIVFHTADCFHFNEIQYISDLLF